MQLYKLRLKSSATFNTSRLFDHGLNCYRLIISSTVTHVVFHRITNAVVGQLQSNTTGIKFPLLHKIIILLFHGIKWKFIRLAIVIVFEYWCTCLNNQNTSMGLRKHKKIFYTSKIKHTVARAPVLLFIKHFIYIITCTLPWNPNFHYDNTHITAKIPLRPGLNLTFKQQVQFHKMHRMNYTDWYNAK